MTSPREATTARRSNMAAALRRGGVPRARLEHTLTVVVRGIYEALWRTLTDARRADACFDPMTALLEHVSITGLSKRYSIEEELIATSLAITVPRLLGQISGTKACDERFAIRALSFILQLRFPSPCPDA